jgi:ubiquinone/menaquinone biosynthesis C-methylase UbiE
MPEKREKWSGAHWKRMLVDQRKHMWHPDSIAMFACWAGLRPGMTVVDVGCGLGYMGFSYWPHFGRRGRYLGIDVSTKLLGKAKSLSLNWAGKGRVCFAAGDAGQLPMADGTTDAVMCQTLLMHLPDPQRAVCEMARILKRGGVMICHEPDNLSSSMTQGYTSVPQPNLEDRLFIHRINLYRYLGSKKIHGGDPGIGCRVPLLMKEAGLRRIGARLNDHVHLMIPPYEDEEQKHRMKLMRRHMNDKKGSVFWRKREKEEILAGGGRLPEVKRYWALIGKYNRTGRKQVKSSVYTKVAAGCFYIVKGIKI